MLKADIIMMDDTVLKEVLLFKDRNLGDSQILTRKEAEKYLDFESDRSVFFCGKYVQGGIIPRQILEYRLIEDDESVEERIKDFVNNTNSVFDTNDTAEFIIEYRDQLLEILR